MLINEHTAISTSKLLLVPYQPHHVPTYHEWMLSPALLAATASEPLSLEQEHLMQQSWRQDADKLTFIICQPLPQKPPTEEHHLNPDEKDSKEAEIVGDVNAFFSLPDPDPHHSHLLTIHAELELMIAQPPNRRSGLGRAALITFIHFLFTHEDEIVSMFLAGQRSGNASPEQTGKSKLELLAKIDKENVASLGLFESVGFVRRGEENCFGEVELVLDFDRAQDREQGQDQGQGKGKGTGKERGLRWVQGLMKKFGVEGYQEARYGD